ncbi:MAG: hypothetical protein ACUZ8O_04215 [Candidatus Anammoxibacter sp.]
MQTKPKNTLYQKRISEIKSLYKHWDVRGISGDNHSKINSLFYNYGTECNPDSECHGDSSCAGDGEE